MNNCLPNEDDDNSLCTDDATPFLSIIQTLPSNNHRSEQEATNDAAGHTPVIPCNVFSDLTSWSSYDRTADLKHCETSSVCSILTEQRDCFELARDAGSPTRQYVLTGDNERGEKFFPPPLNVEPWHDRDDLTIPKVTGSSLCDNPANMAREVSKSDAFENAGIIDAVDNCVESEETSNYASNTKTDGKSSPDHEKESKSKTTPSNKQTALNQTEDIVKNKILNSFIGEKVEEKVHCSVTPVSHEQEASFHRNSMNVANKDRSSGKTKVTPKFLKRLRSKLSSRIVSTMDTAVEIAVEPEESDTTPAGYDNDASMDPLLVDIMSLTPKDDVPSAPANTNMFADQDEEEGDEASDDKVLSYNEICYGTPSPNAMITPTPSLVYYSHDLNSIAMTRTTSSRKKAMFRSKHELPCNLSPIVEKPSFELSTSQSFGLDATASLSMTATPDDSDMLNVSSESAQESLTEGSRSLLSDVSRTLFPEEMEGLLAEVSKEDTSFGTGRDFYSECLDDDYHYEAVTIECTLQNDDSGLFDVSIEEGEVDDVVARKDEGLNHCEPRRVQLNDGESNGGRGIKDSSKEGYRPSKLKTNNIFQIDIFSFGELLGCIGAPSSSNAPVVM